MSAFESVQECLAAGEECTVLKLNEPMKRFPYTNQLKQLKHVDRLIIRNIFREKPNPIPDRICEIPNLERIIIENTKFTDLPSRKGLEKCDQLEILEIKGSKLDRIPKRIEVLENLQTLDLERNRIDFISPSISELENLAHLNLSFNQIEDLPSEFGSLNVIYLDLGYNTKLGKFPLEITQLEKLKELSLEKTKLKSIPPEIENLTKLRTLNLNKNKIETIPPELGNLSILDFLQLGDNSLKSLPPEMGNLENLRFLDVSGNNLKNLPIEMEPLKDQSLETIKTRKNDARLQSDKVFRSFLWDPRIEVSTPRS